MDFDRLDKILKQRKISRRKLALAVGILPGTMSTAFSRRSGLSASNVMKIAQYLGVNPLYLEGLEDDPHLSVEESYDKLVSSEEYAAWVNGTDTGRMTALMVAYDALNVIGRNEAVKILNNLTFVPDYSRGSSPAGSQPGDGRFYNHDTIMEIMEFIRSQSDKEQQ